jgi:wyosine [tRNA(Phe)-imidazoG37] synthetase (radical SAM superfamily)
MSLSIHDHDRRKSGYNYVYAVLGRRAGGVSIGVNLNTNSACNWRCVYCEIPELTFGNAPHCDLALLERELRAQLDDILRGDWMSKNVPEENWRVLKDVAISGNGEPTSCPEFAAVVTCIARVLGDYGLRAKDGSPRSDLDSAQHAAPTNTSNSGASTARSSPGADQPSASGAQSSANAARSNASGARSSADAARSTDTTAANDVQIVLITNGSLVHKPEVQAGLAELARVGGVAWYKLDSATTAGQERMNNAHAGIERARSNLVIAARTCPTWIQTMALARDGEPPAESEVAAYVDLVRGLVRERVPVQGVLLYGLARKSFQPEANELSALPRDWMEAFARRIEDAGIAVRLSV